MKLPTHRFPPIHGVHPLLEVLLTQRLERVHQAQLVAVVGRQVEAEPLLYRVGEAPHARLQAKGFRGRLRRDKQ